MDMKEGRKTMRILHRGNNEGFAYLRTLIIICCILLCFSTVTDLLFNINKSFDRISNQIEMCINALNNFEYEAVCGK